MREEDPDPAEVTFADVLNSLSFGGGRPRAPVRPAPSAAPVEVFLDDEIPEDEVASSVRAYAWTGGRTRAGGQLEIETLISTSARAEDSLNTMRSEHQSVARLCRDAKSVAEIGALLGLPIGVVRVLLDDMAGLGLVNIHTTQTTDGQPDIDLLRRVLRGLSNLRT